MPRASALLALLGLVLAGCLAGPADDGDEDRAGGDAAAAPGWSERALASGHDHADPAVHAGLTTPNFRILGHDPLVSEDYGTTVQGNLCGDATSTRDGRRLAVVETRGDVAFSLVDVTDAAAPKRLGELVMRTTKVYDLAVVPDGRHVVLVTAQHRTPDNPPAGLEVPLPPDAEGALWWRSPCAPGGMGAWHPVRAAAHATGSGPGDDLVPRPASILLVSIEDPAAPAIVDQRPIAGLGHGVSAADVDGETWIVAAALGCTVAAGCPSHAQSFHFYGLLETPLGARLDLRSVYTLPATEEVLNEGHNDAWVSKHPLTGQTLAWLAAWDHGLLVLDLEDPRQPRLVGRWNDHDPAQGPDDSGSIHSAFPFPQAAWDGRHYTVVGPEIIGHPTVLPTGIVRVLDTTDPAKPAEVGAWTFPHDVVWEERLQFSTHYLSAHGRTAFVSAYHGGVWAIDLSGVRPGNWTNLPSVGVFMPVGTSPAPPERPMRWAPTLEEALVFDDGTLVTFDSNTGLYAFAFDEGRPALPPAPWPLEKAGTGS